MANIASLVVEIKGKVDSLQKALTQGKNQVETFEKSSILSFRNIAAAFIAAFSARAVINSITETADAIDHLKDVSKGLNVPVEDIQEFAFAAKTSGSSIDELSRSMKILTTNIGDASLGSNDVSNSLRRLGLNMSVLKVLNPGEQFEAVASALGGIVNDSERASIAIKLFGRDGVNVVNNIADGMDDARRTFRGLNVALSDSQVKAVAGFNDSRDALDAIFQGIKQQTVAALAPSFKSLIDNILQVIKNYGGIKTIAENVAKFISSSISMVIQFFKDLYSNVGTIPEALEKIAPGLGKIGNAISTVASGLADLYKNLVLITTNIIEKLAPIAASLKDTFGDTFSTIGEVIKNFILKTIDFISQLIEKLDVLLDKVGQIGKIASAVSPLLNKAIGGETGDSPVATLFKKFSGFTGSSESSLNAVTNNGGPVNQPPPAQVNIQLNGDVNDFLNVAVTSPTFAEAITSVTDRIMQNTARSVSR